MFVHRLKTNMPQCIEMHITYHVSSEGPFGHFHGVKFSYIKVV